MTEASTRRMALMQIGAGLLTGCGGSLLPKPPATPALYALVDTAPAAPRAGRASAPTLLVGAPRAAAGYDTRLIAYQREAHRIEYFAASEWVDTPAQMLAPMMVRAAEATGAFRAVVRAPGNALADLRLDTELVRLQQDFATAPSRVQLTVKAMLVDTVTRRVLATRELDATVPAASDDAAGGVAAAQQAALQVAQGLAAFCAASPRL